MVKISHSRSQTQVERERAVGRPALPSSSQQVYLRFPFDSLSHLSISISPRGICLHQHLLPPSLTPPPASSLPPSFSLSRKAPSHSSRCHHIALIFCHCLEIRFAFMASIMESCWLVRTFFAHLTLFLDSISLPVPFNRRPRRFGLGTLFPVPSPGSDPLMQIFCVSLLLMLSLLSPSCFTPLV